MKFKTKVEQAYDDLHDEAYNPYRDTSFEDDKRKATEALRAAPVTKAALRVPGMYAPITLSADQT